MKRRNNDVVDMVAAAIHEADANAEKFSQQKLVSSQPYAVIKCVLQPVIQSLTTNEASGNSDSIVSYTFGGTQI